MKSFGDPIWEELFASQAWGRYPSEEAIRFFIPAMRRLGKARVRALDLGCGKGALSWFMRKEGADVVAMDGSMKGLENVPRLASEFGVHDGITVVHGDITDPGKYLDPGFDLIVDHYALYANLREQVVAAYMRIRELLNTGGYFLTCTFGKRSDGYGTGTEIGPGTFSGEIEGPLANRGMVTFFSVEEMREILSDAGFVVEYIETLLQEKDGLKLEKIICCTRKK